MKREEGFSLVELLVLLVILSVMLALMAPMMTKSWENLRFRTAVRSLVSGLRYARLQAISTKTQVDFKLDQENQRYQIAFHIPAGVDTEPDEEEGFEEGLKKRERTVSIPEGVRLKGLWKPGQDSPSSEGIIVFFPRGNSSGGKIVLEDPQGKEQWVNVDAWGGRIKVTSPRES